MLSNSVEYWAFFWDFCCPFIKRATSMPFCKYIVSVPLFLLLQIPRDMWMFCDHISLPEHRLIGTHVHFFICVVDLVLFPSTRILTITSRRDPKEQSQTAQWTWIVPLVLHRLSISRSKPDDSLYFGLFSFPCDLQKQYSQYEVVYLDIHFDFSDGSHSGNRNTVGYLWRMVVLLSNITQFRKWNATVLDTLFVLSFFLFKPNSFLRSTYVDRVWSPDGLKVQYRADDNATTLP